VFPGSPGLTSWIVNVKKPLVKGSKISIVIFYINHPTNIASNIHIVVNANTNTTNPKIVNYSAVPLPAGLITSNLPALAEIMDFWAFPLNPELPQSLFFDLKFQTDLAKGT
jgi:hypothetical protein